MNEQELFTKFWEDESKTTRKVIRKTSAESFTAEERAAKSFM